MTPTMYDTDTMPITIVLAQASSAPPTQESLGSGGGGAMTTTPGGPGAPGIPGTAAPSTSPFDGNMLWLIMLFLGAMILFSMMGTRRERRKREAMLSLIKKHDRVQTIGGMIGSVVEIKPDTIVLKVDESSNTRITFTRAAIQQVLTASAEAETPAA
jgi:preprotein translocase subunit YajC